MKTNHAKIRRRVLALLVPLLTAPTAPSCRDSQPLSVSQPVSVTPPVSVAPPGRDKPIVVQPALEFSDGTVTFQGTAYFVRTPDGGVAAVTASHFLDQDGPALVRVSFLDPRESHRDSLAAATESWGTPGGYGLRPPDHELDLRTDRFLLPVSVDELTVHVLELDERRAPEVGEKAWFPDKQPREPGGFGLVAATVVEVAEGFVIVQLETSITPQSQSGSPVISQATGKVLGSWGGYGVLHGRTILLLTPAAELRKALQEVVRPALSTVVGKPTSVE